MNLLASLRYLAALEQHKHFGRAAQACHITQPALSNAIRALETEFGTAIVKRGRSFGGFTSEGERVLTSAHRMLHERELLQQDLDSIEAAPRGTLAIGSVPTAIPFAARFSATLQARHPGIRLIVRSVSSAELETGLEKLSLDLGLGYIDRMTRGSPRLQYLAQYDEHYFLVRKRIGGGNSTISWADAAALPLCLLSREMHNRAIVEAAFEEAGVVASPAIETNSMLALALSVALGQVCSILPGTLLEVIRGYPELEALPLVRPQVRTAIGFMVPSGERPSRALEAAIALAQDAAWLELASLPGQKIAS